MEGGGWVSVHPPSFALPEMQLARLLWVPRPTHLGDVAEVDMNGEAPTGQHRRGFFGGTVSTNEGRHQVL